MNAVNSPSRARFDRRPLFCLRKRKRRSTMRSGISTIFPTRLLNSSYCRRNCATPRSRRPCDVLLWRRWKMVLKWKRRLADPGEPAMEEHPLNHHQRFLEFLYVVLEKLLDSLPILSFSIRQEDRVRVVFRVFKIDHAF